ncbi:MAG: antibiotic biosynthesis monooxygenase family protein [Bacteroidota bacterium]|nr:antibiotic biosynthesis monooxygenase family protein [Bacteroidota bacterium]MDP3144323.1 antibiotic biosynthesis monooxygenase family protein [Bacteroidota bacterium]MDP3556309.1 antibiotic biosynthesis monooxygenase family protein [Bacteroidota bacterium]
MIKRIVKMSFKQENIEAFKTIFKTDWEKIKGFDGCEHVELLQDTKNPQIFFTYSLWQSEEHLNKYRNSELFNGVWAATKVLFNAKPEAWSVKSLLF